MTRRVVLVLITLASTFAENVGAQQVSRVIDAAKQGDVATLRLLVSQRGDVNAREPDGMSALHWAVRRDDVDAVSLLIKAGADVNAANRYGVTPLWIAATNGSERIVRQLVEGAGDPNRALPSGETALMAAARAGDIGTIKALIAGGAKVNATERTQGQTALMYAATENHAGAITVLTAAGANPNVQSNLLSFPENKFSLAGMVATILPRGGWTALMFAARQGSIDAARALADAHADLDAVDPEGTSALITAIINDHFDLASALLEKGANPNVADQTGMAPLYATVDMHNFRWSPGAGRPLRLTDRRDAVALAQELMDHGANPNARLIKTIYGRYQQLGGDATLGEGSTPFMRAAKSHDMAMMSLLLKAGADATVRQEDRTTAVMIAIGGNARGLGGRPGQNGGTGLDPAIQTIELCLQHGVDVNAFNVDGQTALHVAAASRTNSTIEFLVGKGADLDVTDTRNRTPLDLAIEAARQAAQPGQEFAPPRGDDSGALLRTLMAARGIAVPVERGAAGRVDDSARPR